MLRARANDPNHALHSIPQLNSELINEEISGFYLDWLEDVQRQEALKVLSQKRIGTEAPQSATPGLPQEDDEGTRALMSRKAAILDELHKRRK